MAETPRPIRMSSSAPIQPVGMRSMSRQEMIGGEQVVPGSMQFYEGRLRCQLECKHAANSGCRSGRWASRHAVPDDARNGSWWHAASHGSLSGVGAPPIPMRGDGPNVPNYAWPSYAFFSKLCCPAVSNAVFTGCVALHWPVLSVSTGSAWLASGFTRVG